MHSAYAWFGILLSLGAVALSAYLVYRAVRDARQPLTRKPTWGRQGGTRTPWEGTQEQAWTPDVEPWTPDEEMGWKPEGEDGWSPDESDASGGIPVS